MITFEDKFTLIPGEVITEYGLLPYLQGINGRYLFTEKWDKLPNLFEENVIYAFYNNINHKIYFGQAKLFYERMLVGNMSHLIQYRDQLVNGGNKYLYNAFNKYNLRNFSVYIIKELDSESDLNKVESEYIEKYHTCVYEDGHHGYNMTWGGDDCSNLFTQEVLDKSRMTRDRLYGDNGAGAMNTPEAIRHRIETNIERYGSMTERLNKPEIQKKSLSSRDQLYGGNGAGAMHLQGVQTRANITKLFINIEYNLDKLKSMNLELTPLNYIIAYGSNLNAIRHINNVTRYMYEYPEIKDHPKWVDPIKWLFEWYDDENNWKNLMNQLDQLTTDLNLTSTTIP